MKRDFVGVSLPPNTPLPKDEFFHVDTFAGGFDSRDAQEDLPPGSSPDMLDVEVSRDDRLVRAPGVALFETLAHAPTQIILHPGFNYASDLVLLASPYIGFKGAGATQWFNVGLRADNPYGSTNFAGVLLLSNGVQGIYERQPHKNELKLVPDAPPALGMTVFAERLVLGGTLVSDNFDFMGVGWSGTLDYTDWNQGNGDGNQSMIGNMQVADRFQGFAPQGFNTLAVINRHSIWIGTQTGDVNQPINFEPRLEGVGCVNKDTIVPSEYGTLFLSDDGVRLFTGNEAVMVSEQINQELIIDEDLAYSASYDPTRKRYYLHTPSDTWVFDLNKKRWYRWSGVFLGSVFWPVQRPTGPTWGQLVGTWGQQVNAWWQYFGTQGKGRQIFIRGSKLGFEDPTLETTFDQPLVPSWFDRRMVGDNQDTLMTHLGARFTYEAEADSTIEVWLPDKPQGNPELVATATLPGGPKTQRAWVPFIHTGRGVSLGLKLTNGSPRIRKASVEFQTTGMLFDLDYEGIVSTVPLDAIVKPRILWIQGYDIEAQSLYRIPPYPDALVPTNFFNIASSVPEHGFTWHQTGGEDGGGYVSTKASTGLRNSAGDKIGNYQHLELDYAEGQVKKMGGQFAFDLSEIPVRTQPLNVIGFADAVVRITPDNFVQIGTKTDGGSGFGVQASSLIQVPAAGWFKLEVQAGVYFEGPRASFIIVHLYTSAGKYLLVKALGVNFAINNLYDNIGSIYGVRWGSEVIPNASEGLDDLKIDNVIIYGDYGIHQQVLGPLYITQAIPNRDTFVRSSITWTSSRTFSSATPTTFTKTVSHGDTERWKNVSGILKTPDPESTYPHCTFGLLSLFTGDWLSWPDPLSPPFDGASPIDPPMYSDFPSLSAQRFSEDADSIVIRNTLYDLDEDQFGLGIKGSIDVIKRIHGVFPYNRVMFRTLHGGVTGYGPFGGFQGDYPLVSKYGLIHGDGRAVASDYVTTISLDSDTILTRPNSAYRYGSPITPNIWFTDTQYKIGPYTFIELDPANSEYTVQNLMTRIQLGIKLDWSSPLGDVNLHPGLGQVDVGELGLDIVYQHDTLDYTTELITRPVAYILPFNVNVSTRVVQARDGSVDWLGAVVGSVVDWGDGVVESIAPQSVVSHTYADPGIYSITITATNALGLTDTYTTDPIELFIPNVGPVAAFSIAVDPSDPSGLTVNFMDLSSDDVAVVAWDWDFGDGSPHSNLQNPTHVYVAPGTYNVVLLVHDAGGQAGQLALSDSTTAPITVPLEVPVGDCTLSAGAISDLPGYQGDDFNGGNPPLPAYVNTAAFDSVYEGSNFRRLYDTAYAAPGVDHVIDSSVKFNGHSTLRMDWGAGHTGAGWESGWTDDGDPTENDTIDNVGSGAFGPIAGWQRLILKADPGIVPGSEVSSYTGLLLHSISGRNVDLSVYMRQGRLKLDVDSRLVFDAAHTTATYDLCDSALFERTDGLFGELITLAEVDEGANTLRVRGWAGNACSLVGSSPLVDQTIPAFGSSGFAINGRLQFDFTSSHFNWTFTTTGAIKGLWVALWEQVAKSTAANPFDVSLT